MENYRKVFSYIIEIMAFTLYRDKKAQCNMMSELSRTGKLKSQRNLCCVNVKHFG